MNPTQSSATTVETRDIPRETVKSSREVRQLDPGTENHLADLEQTDLLDPDPEETETNWIG